MSSASLTPKKMESASCDSIRKDRLFHPTFTLYDPTIKDDYSACSHETGDCRGSDDNEEVREPPSSTHVVVDSSIADDLASLRLDSSTNNEASQLPLEISTHHFDELFEWYKYSGGTESTFDTYGDSWSDAVSSVTQEDSEINDDEISTCSSLISFGDPTIPATPPSSCSPKFTFSRTEI